MGRYKLKKSFGFQAHFIRVIKFRNTWDGSVSYLAINTKKDILRDVFFLEALSAGRTGVRALARTPVRISRPKIGELAHQAQGERNLRVAKFWKSGNSIFVLTIFFFKHIISAALGGLRANLYPPSCKDGVTYIRAWAIVKQESYPAAIPKKNPLIKKT